MRVIGLTFLLLAGCGRTPEPNPSDIAHIAKAISDAALTKDTENPLVRVEVFPIPGEKDLYVSIQDWQDHWWGDFDCFKYAHGRIECMCPAMCRGCRRS